jgi:GNAT superfamily N-acetyltransferase
VSGLDLVVRDFVESDREAVIALWRRCGLTRPWNDPSHDIDLAIGNGSSTILVGTVHDQLVATTMVGFDGHRGWIYYVAVAPDHVRRGFGRAIMAAAEDWLRERHVPKVELLVRTENGAVLNFYDGLGYERQDVVVMARWLRPPNT